MPQTFARIVDGVVQEIISLPDEIRIEDAFHPRIVEQCVICPTNVGQRWTYDNGSFKEPPPQ